MILIVGNRGGYAWSYADNGSEGGSNPYTGATLELLWCCIYCIRIDADVGLSVKDTEMRVVHSKEGRGRPGPKLQAYTSDNVWTGHGQATPGSFSEGGCQLID